MQLDILNGTNRFTYDNTAEFSEAIQQVNPIRVLELLKPWHNMEQYSAGFVAEDQAHILRLSSMSDDIDEAQRIINIASGDRYRAPGIIKVSDSGSIYSLFARLDGSAEKEWLKAVKGMGPQRYALLFPAGQDLVTIDAFVGKYHNLTAVPESEAKRYISEMCLDGNLPVSALDGGLEYAQMLEDVKQAYVYFESR